MLLFANKARSTLTGSVTSAAGQVAAVATGSGALFVGVGGVATSASNPMRCVLTAVDASGNDTGAFEVVEVVRSGDNLTLQSRGLEGTAAAAWGSGTVIECRSTAGSVSVGSVRTVHVSTSGVAMSPTTQTSLLAEGPYTIPANLMVPGDRLRCLAFFHHVGSSSAPTVGLQLDDIAPPTSTEVANDSFLVRLFTEIVYVNGNVALFGRFDNNSASSTTAYGYYTGYSPAVSHTIDANGSFPSTTSDTIQCVYFSIELIRINA